VALELSTHEHFAPNDDGWLLHLKQVTCPERFDASLHPIVIVPGYGMNAFIFGFHPRGTSMERSLAEAGFEVWSVNLRTQGDARRQKHRPPPPSLRAFAETDLRAAVEAIVGKTTTRRSRVSLVGASLGGTISYAHLALHPDHRVQAVVTIGSPLDWVEVPLVFRAIFRHPTLVGSVRVRGTRTLAQAAFPLLARLPLLITPYMNPANVDLAAAAQMTQTVENPHPRVNRDIAHWIQERRLVLRGVTVGEALRSVDLPLMLVLANRDGIVPEAAALSAADCWGGRDIELLRVGDERQWYAHADLFVGNEAPRVVFAPLADWLTRKSRAAA
jgi:pimeloyl-ACP methyl ester carboxylesterase